MNTNKLIILGNGFDLASNLESTYKHFFAELQLILQLSHWLLVRKLNTFGKVVIAIILWLLWLKYAFNLVFMVNFLKVIVLITIIYWLADIYLRVKNKLKK